MPKWCIADFNGLPGIKKNIFQNNFIFHFHRDNNSSFLFSVAGPKGCGKTSLVFTLARGIFPGTVIDSERLSYEKWPFLIQILHTYIPHIRQNHTTFLHI